MSVETPIEPRRPRWRRWLVPSVATLVVVCVGVTVTTLLVRGHAREKEQLTWCAVGIRKLPSTGECVGISDGRYAFASGHDPAGDAELTKVQDLIRTENARIGRDEPHFAIVYLLPMSWDDSPGAQSGSAVRQLYGAYAAQLRANAEGERKIRLLVANTGHEGVAWEQVAGSIVERRVEDRIWVVTGLGPSLPNTEKLAKLLSTHQIPMVGSTLTADHLNGSNFPHLYRVTPTNREQTDIGLRFLRRIAPSPTTPRPNHTFLVVQRQSNPGDADPYVARLEKAFRALFGENFATRAYSPGAENLTQLMGIYAGHICSQSSPVRIYFAGRAAALRTLLVELKQCDPRAEVTILTGDDASNLVISPGDEQTTLARRGIRLYYTGLAHPDQWQSGSAQLHALVGWLRGVVPHLEDGAAMMAFDSVLLAVTAIRRLGSAAEARPSNLFNSFHSLTDGDPYCGVSGPIGLATSPAPDGTTLNKALPVIRLQGGRPVLQELRYPADKDRTKPGDGAPTSWSGKCGLPAELTAGR